MPQQIELSGNRSIQNMYATDGRKLKTTVKEGEELMDGTKYYNANFVFDKQKEMEYILFDEGRIVNYGGNLEYEYHVKDHLGSVRVAFNPTADGPNIVQENAYYPFGGTIGDFSYNESENRYKHTGMEAINDFGLNMLDNNARWRDVSAVPRFYGIDPLAEKYYSISPYAYCTNNPVKHIDPDGREIWISFFKGFKRKKVKYEDGKLYNKDGTAYTGKTSGFLGKAVKALGSLKNTAEGASLVSELQGSTNIFTIRSSQDGLNKFVANNPSKTGSNLVEVQAVKGSQGSAGSGGTIYWNANSTSGGLDLSGGTTRPAYIGLGHEMAHASDANQGLLHSNDDYTNFSTGATYISTHNGLLKSEWRATFRENLIRAQAGIPMRTHYERKINESGDSVGVGPLLLMPIRIPLTPLSILFPINYP